MARILVWIFVAAPVASAPSWADGSALLLASSARPADGSSDGLIRDRLIRLGFSVQVQDVDASSFATSADLIVVSNSVEASVVAARLRGVRKPVVILDFRLFDDMEMTSATGGSLWSAQIRVVDGDHLMANDPVNPVLTVYRQDAPLGFAYAATLPGAAEKVAVAAGDSSRMVIFGFESGAAMDGGLKAPARRVGYHVTDASRLNATGWAMFEAWSNGQARPAPRTAAVTLSGMCRARGTGRSAVTCGRRRGHPSPPRRAP
jgi:hypothetical protein